MELHFVYKIIPVPVFYTNWISRGGVALGIFVLIRHQWRTKGRVLVHELEHVRQFYKLPVLHLILYALSHRYRLWSEVEAYSLQAMEVPRRYRFTAVKAYATFIAERYGLDISVEKAQELLLGTLP